MDKSPGSNLGSAKEEQGSEDLKQSTADMTQFVQNLLVQMQNRFQTMSDSIISKNEMGNKIDELEQSINHLKAEMGMDGAVKATTPEETKPSEGTE